MTSLASFPSRMGTLLSRVPTGWLRKHMTRIFLEVHVALDRTAIDQSGARFGNQKFHQKCVLWHGRQRRAHWPQIWVKFIAIFQRRVLVLFVERREKAISMHSLLACMHVGYGRGYDQSGRFLMIHYYWIRVSIGYCSLLTHEHVTCTFDVGVMHHNSRRRRPDRQRDTQDSRRVLFADPKPHTREGPREEVRRLWAVLGRFARP
jgi:hypothetical protein